MTTAHIVAVSVSFALIAGWFGGIAFMMFGKNGWLDLSKKLKALLAEHEQLKTNLSSDGAGKSERKSVEKSSARSSSTSKKKVLLHDGGENDASAQSGPTGARIALPDNWRQESCNKSGHLFDPDTGRCYRCTAKQALPDDIEQIRAAEMANS